MRRRVLKIHDPESLCINVSSGIVFLTALITYWLTVDPSASFWDCPEYVTCASRLEIGHPPGNPVWMLAMRAVTIPFKPSLHPLVINLCSGIFMALAALFLSRIIFHYAVRISRIYLTKHGMNDIGPEIYATAASIAGGLCFAVCDSAWFSAVEAEVYAMSAFLSSFVIWLMLCWSRTLDSDPSRSNRILILIAYLTGLSLGIHQLNLLCIPVLALIYVFRKNPYGRCTWKAWGAVFLSFAIIAAILIGMMNGIPGWAETFELFTVNSLGLPYFSGVFLYLSLLFTSAMACAVAIARGSRASVFATLLSFLWLSGYFVFKDSLSTALAISSIMAGILTYLLPLTRAALSTFFWSATFIVLGFMSFSLILIRGYAAPPMNEGAPTDIFALSSYISREQYGSTPLLYGPTPYSKPMVEEKWAEGKSSPDYSRYILRKDKAEYVPYSPDPRLSHRSGLLNHTDSSANRSILNSGKTGYLLADYSFTRVTTPELDMFFPRITSSALPDIENYGSWAGMNKETMKRVRISETFDSAGNAVGRMDISGKRSETYSYRPTYLQNLKFFLSYQVSYMYLRYLLWNFMGRQNDIPSTGEIDHGNFITGFPFIDNAMLGDQSRMPANASRGNPGRNVYYGIPFILGISGIIFLASRSKEGRRALAVFTIFFLMTGLAIVVYLNQTPGEPRERDYSFLGSYMAFAGWIGFAIAGIGLWISGIRLPRIVTLTSTVILTLFTPIIMVSENYDDHNREGRSEPRDFASNILLSGNPSIIFTHGDNFTFPLWYAQEVEGIGKDHTVVDVSYLVTPEYVINLMKQDNRGIKLTAKPSDIAYGAYAFTRIPDNADTIPVPLLSALKDLYSSKTGKPEFHHRCVTLPGLTEKDTIVIDLKDFANGSSMLTFKKLMLLDILATNLSSGNPKEVLFLSILPTELYKPIKEATRRVPFGRLYYPILTDSGYHDMLRKKLEIPLSLPERDQTKTVYPDPVIAEHVRRQRGEIFISARSLMETGDSPAALESILAAERIYPYHHVPAGSFTTEDSTYHEGIEFSRLLLEFYGIDNDTVLFRKASRLISAMLSESKKWRSFYASLPEWRRNTVSNASLRKIHIIRQLQELRMICDSIESRTKTELTNKNI